MKKLLSFLFLSASAAVLVSSAYGAEPKRVIVCTVTTGFRHPSIPIAEQTLQKLADESHAYTIVDFARQPEAQVPQKPNKPGDLKPDADDKAKARHDADMKKYDDAMAKWTAEDDAKVKDAKAKFDSEMKASLAKLSPENLVAQKIDGVIFANTTGDLPLPDRDGFIKWIEDGHAFMGMHSASDTFHGYPKYLEMLGGEFETHHAQVPVDLIVADQASPATAGLPNPWDLKQEELYHIKRQDRSKVHMLLFMRHDPNDAQLAGFFPVSWCREAGKGRVFYTSLGHREDLWSDDPNLRDRKNPVEISKEYQQHILGGIKWALGLAQGSDKPNPEVK
jgi:type 1 glutamine amidotransferase